MKTAFRFRPYPDHRQERRLLGMVEAARRLWNDALAKSIHDAGWSQLVRFAEYKGPKAGKQVVRVPAAYSTQECFFCGALNKVPLSVRRSECASCGRTLD
ncbi:MAG: transposase, partial [Nitrososphaerota archaeon]|nr:transposase [Nitrososphaerota archaeon]